MELCDDILNVYTKKTTAGMQHVKELSISSLQIDLVIDNFSRVVAVRSH